MYKKLIIASVAFLGFSAIAAANDGGSIYVGTQFGRAQTNYDGSSYTLSSNSVDDKNFGGRLYAGYAFTDLLSAELGYGYYGKPEFKHNPDGNKQSMLQQGVDLLGKISLPLDYGFGCYVKAGGMWVHRDALESRGGYFVSKNANGKVVPTGGLGVTYSFNSQWGTDVFWTGTMSGGNLPKMYFYGVGLTYKFNKGGDSISVPASM